MAALEDIQAKTEAILTKVEASTTTIANIAALVTSLKQQIADLQAGTTGTDPASLQRLSDTVDKISTVVDANAAAEAAIVG